MLVFIDESWDSWFKFNKWSSEFFTVSLVIFNDYDEALLLDNAINDLRKSLNNINFGQKIKKNPLLSWLARTQEINSTIQSGFNSKIIISF